VSGTRHSGALKLLERVHRLLLLAYPSEFRVRYGREMQLLFRNHAKEVVGRRKRLALMSYTAHVLWDLTRSTVRERYEMVRLAHVVATLQGMLILPAALFLSAVALRRVPPLHDSAQWVVMLYAGRVWTLWLLLLTLPFCVVMIGCLTVVDPRVGQRGSPDHLSPFNVIFGAPAVGAVVALTLLSVVVLIIVVLHMLAN
jgi:hypothetical protein